MTAARTTVLALALGVFLMFSSAFAQESEPLQEPVKPVQEQADQPKASESAQPAQKAEAETVSEMKEISGEISGISSDFIAVAYGVSADGASMLESAFNVSKNVQTVHKRSFKDFKQGDTVTLRYEELVRSFPDGRKVKTKTLKSIKFLKAAPKETQSAALKTPEEAPTDSMPLKGIKGR